MATDDLESLTDLEHIRKRPGMYVGDTDEEGLHHLFVELLDNSVDQFLAGNATTIVASTDGTTLDFYDDGPGLPFDEPSPLDCSLATYYLTVIRRDSPTADGHAPHIHLGRFGCGLRIVTALTETCAVTSRRSDRVWHQSFTRGLEDGPAELVAGNTESGTVFRLSPDREQFSAGWSQKRIDDLLRQAAYLFPGLRVQSPNIDFIAPRGLADDAESLAIELGSTHRVRTWWFNETVGDFRLQAAISGDFAGTGGLAGVGDSANQTKWRAFANGSVMEKGTHLEALQQVVAECQLTPAVGLIHVVLSHPRFSGSSRTVLDVPELLSPICAALMPSLKAFAESLSSDPVL
ncbi:MAG: ATP-binding protein [Planctomycetota bacterium]